MRKRPFWLVFVLVATLLVTALPLGASAQEGDDEHPVFLTGPNEGDPEDIAIDYVQDRAEELEVSPADVSDLAVRSSYTSDHNGVTHVNLNQRFQGREVFGADTTVNIAEDGSVIHIGGATLSGLQVAGSGRADVDPVEAVDAAAEGLDLDEPEDVRQLPQVRTADGPDALLTDGGISEDSIPARLGWQPTDDGLRLAWQLVIDDASDVHLWNATVDADTGELLESEDWTSESNVNETADRLGHLRGRSSGSAAVAAASSSADTSTPNPVDDGSDYRVFELPIESPNDGGRSLASNPADADASPFGWHDTDGNEGPEYTITRGNNVHAYTDWNDSNNPQGGELLVTVDEPSSAAGEYAATGANFGPSPDGESGDIEVVDDGTANPTEGCEELIDFTDGAIALIDRGSCNFTLKVNNAQAAGAVAVIVANNVAGNPITMGGSDPDIVIPSVMVSMDDGQTIKDGLPASGSIAFEPVDSEPEGGADLTFDFPLDLSEHPHEYWEASVTNLFYWCNTIHDVFWHYGFDEESGNFQENNYGNGGVGGDPVDCEAQDGGGTNNANFATPSNDGGRPRMQMYLWNVGPDPERDGDLESGIIIHEYGHGVSNRLTGGPGVNCIGGTQRMGEGWSDYLAITTLIDPELDDPDGPRGMGTYALWEDEPPRQGDGIRPRPYSRDMFIQPFTYESISSNGWLDGATLAAPHHIGHGWASVLWDMTWDLIDKHGFNPNVYEDWSTGGNNLALQLVMDGLKFQGCNPGFLDGRDAIIAAETALTGGEDFCTLWASFARRGLGYSAVQDEDLGRNGNVDGFDTHPTCAEGFQNPVKNSGDEGLNTVDAGRTIPLKFDLGSNQGTDILASNSPYSRQVDCDTLEVVQEGEFATPKATPTDTDNPGNSELSVNGRGVYSYPWQTAEDWVDTCRELVLTRTDGVQHRAFFEFDG